MGKLYNDFLCIAKSEKIHEKVMLVRISISIIVILSCMAAMCFTAYAYFTHSATSATSNIRAAYYELAVTAPDGITETNGYYILDNSGTSTDKTYQFKLTKPITATASVGYAKIEIKSDLSATDAQVFYTKPIGKFLNGTEQLTVDNRTVSITLGKDKIAYLKITGEWGSCTQAVVEEIGGVIPISIGVEPPENKLSETKEDSDLKSAEENSGNIDTKKKTDT